MRIRELAGIAVLVLGTKAAAAPEAQPWERWSQQDAESTSTIDHSAWEDFLQRYVTPDGGGLNRVDYARVTSPDRAALEGYIRDLSEVPISRYSRAEQLPYWINLYNALTVDVVLDHYPVESIRDVSISPGFFSVGPWKKPLVQVEGESLTLDDIEHRILRPIWRDPHIHYGVNCAAVSCPNLMRHAYTRENAEELLTQGAADYVNSPRGVEIRDGRLIVSSIYVWFEADFGGSEQSVLEHLKQHARPELRRELTRFQEIDDDRYDWGLNDQPATRRAAENERQNPRRGSESRGRGSDSY